MLMGWSKASTVDTTEASRIVRDGAADESEANREQAITRLKALQAGVLARAGAQERARAVLGELDVNNPDIASYRGAALALLGDLQEARAVVTNVARRSELAAAAMLHGRIFRDLVDHSVSNPGKTH